MKTLVISAIIAMTSLVNVVSAAAVNRTDNFAYNTETNERPCGNTNRIQSGESEIPAPPPEVQLHLRQLRSHLPKRSAEMERIHAKL